MTDEVDFYNTAEYFVEKLHSIKRVGPCRRLCFVINCNRERGVPDPVVRLVLPAEVIAEIAQMLAADVQTGSSMLASLPIPAGTRAN
jgi:hypothetical protein